MSRNFYIEHFENTAAMDISGKLSSGTAVTDATDVSATAVVFVDLSYLKHAFHFTSDGLDITDADSNDAGFDLSANGFANLFNATNRSLLGNAQVQHATTAYGGLASVPTAYTTAQNGASYATGTRGIKYDIVRDIAQQLFNTYHGADLFTNETPMRNSAHDKINELVAAGTTDHANAGAIVKAIYDCSRNGYVADVSKNIGSEILRQMLAVSSSGITLESDPSGSNNSYPGGSGVTDVSYFYMPFQENDSIQFKLNVSGGPGVRQLIGGTGTTHRRYDVRIVAKYRADVTSSNVAPTDDDT